MTDFPAAIEAQMVSLTEAAALLGISRRGAYYLAKRGEFPVRVQKVGTQMRVSRRLLEQFVAGEVEA